MGIVEKEAAIDHIFDRMLKTQYTKDSVLREKLTRAIVRKLSMEEIGQLLSIVTLSRATK